MDGNNVKKDDENGQLSCRIYSYPAAACLLLQNSPTAIDIQPNVFIQSSNLDFFVTGCSLPFDVCLFPKLLVEAR